MGQNLATAELRIPERDLIDADILPPAISFVYYTDRRTRERVIGVIISTHTTHVCLRFDASDVCVLCGNKDYSTWPVTT